MNKYRAIVTVRAELYAEANNIDAARDIILEMASDMIDPTVPSPQGIDVDIELIEDID